MEKRQQDIFKIVVTGPESTGKTTLAETLAGHLKTVWAPEFARYYVAHLGRPYVREDLARIGRGQEIWELWYALHADQWLICDTDWTVLQIWEQYRYTAPVQGPWEWEKGYSSPKNADLYLLCAPDFPWQPDPLRENPEEREALFGLYERLLAQSMANYVALWGAPDQRVEQALSAIRKFS